MLPIHFAGDQAAFYRVYQKAGTHQIALVLLNKGDRPADFAIDDKLQPGVWKSAFGGKTINVPDGGFLDAKVAAHDVQVYLLDASATRPDLAAELTRLSQERAHSAN
jgi:hypothetical protein